MGKITLTKENNDLYLDMFVARATPVLITISPPKKALQSIGMKEPALDLFCKHLAYIWLNIPIVWHKDISGHTRDTVILLQETHDLKIVFEE